jgi:hypothetical protein
MSKKVKIILCIFLLINIEIWIYYDAQTYMSNVTLTWQLMWNCYVTSISTTLKYICFCEIQFAKKLIFDIIEFSMS